MKFKKNLFVLRNISETRYKLDIIQPAEALYLDIIGSIRRLSSYSFWNLEYNLKTVMNLLTPRELKTLNLYYGFEGDFYNITDIAKRYEVSSSTIKEILDVALRKLRHGSRRKYIINTEKILLNSLIKEDTSNYENKLINDLQSYLEDKHSEYIDNIFCCNNITIKLDSHSIIEKETVTYVNGITSGETSIECLDFSIITYNCLKRAGINTWQDVLNLTYDEATTIRNLGKKGYDEIQEKKSELADKRIIINESYLIHYSIDYNDKTKSYRKLCPCDAYSVSKTIYNTLIEEFDSIGAVYKLNLSNRLIDYLLIKGYFFIESIIKDKEKLIKELCDIGLEPLSCELNHIDLNALHAFLLHKKRCDTIIVPLNIEQIDMIYNNTDKDVTFEDYIYETSIYETSILFDDSILQKLPRQITIEKPYDYDMVKILYEKYVDSEEDNDSSDFNDDFSFDFDDI